MLAVHCTGKADVTIKIKDDDFMEMVSGKLTPQKVWHRIHKYLLFVIVNGALYNEHF